MDDSLLEQLLYSEESSSLDFKREQYPFTGESSEVKSELLKDILAFANSWRQENAYILIGIDEKVAGKSVIVGISNHLNESNIQQFVNSKTNKPVAFSYSTYTHNGDTIGIITIPVQKRPFYLKRDFGNLKKEKVYIRRGSSTAIASPEEIALIGESFIVSQKIPAINIQLGNKKEDILSGDSITIESTLLKLPRKENLDRPSVPFATSGFLTNKNYYREFADYLFEKAFLGEFNFYLENTGSVVLKKAQLKFEVPIDENCRVHLSDHEPYKPSESSLGAHIPLGIESWHNNFYSLSVEQKNNAWKVQSKIGDIQPKDISWSLPIFIGTLDDCSITFNVLVYGENLPEPVNKTFEIHFTVKEGVYSRQEVINMAQNA